MSKIKAAPVKAIVAGIDVLVMVFSRSKDSPCCNRQPAAFSDSRAFS
jgi:hypothetical protein